MAQGSRRAGWLSSVLSRLEQLGAEMAKEALDRLYGRTEQIAPAPPRKREKERRPSTETKVRTREMQEDPAAPAQPAPARKKPGAQGPRGSSGPDWPRVALIG